MIMMPKILEGAGQRGACMRSQAAAAGGVALSQQEGTQDERNHGALEAKEKGEQATDEDKDASQQVQHAQHNAAITRAGDTPRHG